MTLHIIQRRHKVAGPIGQTSRMRLVFACSMRRQRSYKSTRFPITASTLVHSPESRSLSAMAATFTPRGSMFAVRVHNVVGSHFQLWNDDFRTAPNRMPGRRAGVDGAIRHRRNRIILDLRSSKLS